LARLNCRMTGFRVFKKQRCLIVHANGSSG
jgi:hypothetical protein